MDLMALPDNLRPESMLPLAENDFPISQANPVTGYRTSLYRHGADADFLGWIQLTNGEDDAGYIYIRRPVASPNLGSSGYVVMDVPPELLDALLSILQSDEPLQIRFDKASAASEASAFLEHRG